MENLENLMYVDEQEEKEKIYNSEMKEAYKNGEIKGQIEGELKKTKEAIKNATKMGLTLEQISNLVNLPINELPRRKHRGIFLPYSNNCNCPRYNFEYSFPWLLT